MGIFLLGRPPLSMMTLINFTKHSTYVYDKRCRLGSCWLGGKIMEFWVEKQGCLPPMLNFCTILYFVESFAEFTYMKNRDVCRRCSHQTFSQFCTLLKVLQNSHTTWKTGMFAADPPHTNFCTILYLVESFAKFTYIEKQWCLPPILPHTHSTFLHNLVPCQKFCKIHIYGKYEKQWCLPPILTPNCDAYTNSRNTVGSFLHILHLFFWQSKYERRGSSRGHLASKGS